MDMLELLYAQAPRLTFFDMSRPGEDDSSLAVQFNPSEFVEKVEAEYGRLQPLGHPHQVLQYQGTTNWATTMQVFWLVRDEPTMLQLRKARRFLSSLVYPSGSAQSVVTGGPPDVLVVWPNTQSMVVRITGLTFQNHRFSHTGEVIQWTATINYEERRTTRWTSEDARRSGALRSG